jgi:uncharacterized protein YyaL (SSP411 family)
MSILPLAFFLKECSPTQSPTTTDHSEYAHTNALIDESSPYLLQHAHNPVDWYPWGDEALAKATEEKKPIIISIGYAACHWCHVMEHESFEDEEVATYMNDNFVNIKVDREERPDIDDVYMTACNLITGKGGWPLNAVALPDGKPFFAGTYFPKEDWMNILKQIVDVKTNDYGKLVDSANKIAEGIQETDIVEVNTNDVDWSQASLKSIESKFIKRIDFANGGRLGAPKFPMPNNYEFLLKYGTKENDKKALQAVELTLDKMARGGIYDQLGGGFSRYSVDEVWLVPHFEKMLYDNGQLISLYSQGYQVFKNPLYLEVIDESIEFVKRELMSSDYGFYSSLDADSEGEEGKFYVFSEAEVDSLIADELDLKYFKKTYDVSKLGNWEHTNILNKPRPISDMASKFGLAEKDLKTSLDRSRSILFDYRAKRIRPGLDDKILASWNGLMLKGLVDAYNATGKDDYLELALKNANFIKKNFIKEDYRMDRNYKNGKSTINAFLDDYALVAYAYHSLYEATLDESWLALSKNLVDYTLKHFNNEETRMFNYTSDLDPPLIARKTENNDNVIPGSNSMMARNLYRVGSMYYDQDYMKKGTQMLKNLYNEISETTAPDFYSNWLQLYYDKANPPYEVAIIGDNAATLRSQLSKSYLGNAMLLGGKDEGSLPLLKNKLQEGETTIYVCQNKTCKLPVYSALDAIKLMQD